MLYQAKQEKRMGHHMEYKLRWGSNTWIVVLLASALIGTFILLTSYWGMGEAWHNAYYVPLLGYYVMLSICQSHYFKSDPKPHWSGLARQWVSITGAVFMFFVHEYLMGEIIGIPSNLIMPGQFTFIVFGFFFFGMDDFMFKGQLSRWLKRDVYKGLFWYAVVWIVWLPLFALDWGPIAALGAFDPTALFFILGSFQWVIMMQMMVAITWRDYLDTVKFRNNYIRGIQLLTLAMIAGFAIGYLCYQIVTFVDPSIAAPDRWHHVLYMGTYPLIPIILFGIFSNHFNNIGNVRRRAGFRTLWIAAMVITGYLIFRFGIAPSGLFGTHHWYHHFDLVFNFTVSIIPLSHHWFCGRAGLLRPKR